MSGRQPGIDSLPSSLAHEVDGICDRFEKAWNSREPPRIERFVADFTDQGKDHLFHELLGVEVELRQASGEVVRADEYRQRFPDRADVVDDIFVHFRKTSQPTLVHRGLVESDKADHQVHSSGANPVSHEVPAKIGKYRIIRQLGQGAFGIVYLARHPHLDRDVALKVARPDRFRSSASKQAFLAEARNAAQVEHPYIVRIYDVDMDDDQPFIVQEYVDAGDLSETLERHDCDPSDAARIIVDVADALAHAHQQGLYHRDLKPSNILLDTQGHGHVADFGLALHESHRHRHRGERCGTPRYMPPEQVRGESHRLDGRSDIWSLGVILYELLVGRTPFVEPNHDELFDEILHSDVIPPRQINPSIPFELERICLKCLAKRMADRFTTAHDLADDLRHWLSRDAHNPERDTQTAPAATAQVVPKGLRSFDTEDADFFLELLPGPRDRNGLPDVLRFWKNHIECTDVDQTFTVGLIYGPSGSGKSSIIRAGLQPRLSQSVIPMYVEATPRDTELRVLKGLRKRFPSLPDRVTLPEMLAQLREGAPLPADHKLLLILDQFEQWLHATHSQERSQLLDALRQCDGVRVQCLILVLDDFWMAATRFLRALEIELVQGHNVAAIDRFDLRHAKKVLTLFGQAYGAIPQELAELTHEQETFLEDAIQALSDDGRVISLRLALFADMIKSKPWTPATLKAAGGAEGIGLTFLEETFASAGANPKYRLHVDAAQEVLRELLPDGGLEIKGYFKSYTELLGASRYAQHKQDFDELLGVLDGELRLITPVDPLGGSQEPTIGALREETHYQLTHDYMVASIREWLNQKQQETRAGRAELRLAERATLWRSKRERKQLPTWWEWSRILFLTHREKWSAAQRRMMSAATRLHVTRTLTFLGLGLILLISSWQGISFLNARALANRLQEARTDEVLEIIDQLDRNRWSKTVLRTALRRFDRNTDDSIDVRRITHLCLALQPGDKDEAEYLLDRMQRANAKELAVIRTVLKPFLVTQTERLWDIVEGTPGYDQGQRFRTACALAVADGESPHWPESVHSLATHLVSEPSGQFAEWADLFEPIRDLLIPKLRRLCLANKNPQFSQNAAMVFANYVKGDVEAITEIISKADASVVPIFIYQTDAKKITLLEYEIHRLAATLDKSGRSDDDTVRMRGNLALARMLLSDDVKEWPLLEFRPDPSVRTYLIHNLNAANIDATNIVNYLLGPAAQDKSELSRRRALILSLGAYPADAFPSKTYDKFVSRLRTIAQETPDPGLRSAISFLLRRWEVSEPAENRLTSPAWPKGLRRWNIDSAGHMMVIVPGSSAGSNQEYSERDQPVGGLDHSFAISHTEVTVSQFEDCCGKTDYAKDTSPYPDCPINNVRVSEAWKYCLALSEQEKIPADQMCYRLTKSGSIEPYKDILQRTGYRLPTVAEWQAACRAGSTAQRYFGESPQWLSHYAWSQEHPIFLNQEYRTQQVAQLMPNELGLFDMYGNVEEWCVTENGDVKRCGGSFYAFASKLTSTQQLGLTTFRAPRIGFRVCRTVPHP